MTEGLNFKKLSAVLAWNHLLRRPAAKRWFREVGRVCKKQIRLIISRKSIRPYMQESGGVWLYQRDFFRAGYLFFASAHEAAHFLLMRDQDYGALKALDKEYPPDKKDRQMNSPLEYCANLLTLTLFEKCLKVTKGRRRQKILWCIARFKEQGFSKEEATPCAGVSNK